MKRGIYLLPFILALFLPREEGSDIVYRIQAKYEAMNSLSARFTQTLINKTYDKKLIERGRLYIKKPGKMRWEYEKPEKKLFISDGKKIYWYLVEDNEVQIMDFSTENPKKTPILFLMGKGNLLRDFTVIEVELKKPIDKDSYQLKLVPKDEEDFEYLLLEVERKRALIERMIIVDQLGNITDFIFSDIKEDPKLPDSLFTFTIPKGAEVYRVRGKGE